MFKEQYFSPQTIESKSLEIYQQLGGYRHKQSVPFTPSHSALLVLDMQDYFLETSSHAYIPSAKAIIPGVKSLIQAYSTRGLRVIFTRHLNTPQDARLMAKWWHDLITDKDPLSQITTELDTTAAIVLQKSQYDALHKTPLEEILHNWAVTQVVICGVMTHLCCETTARSAFMRGFEVFFTVDGTATYNEEFHRATLINLSHGFATLVMIKDLLASLTAV